MPIIGLSCGLYTTECVMPGLERVYVNRDYVAAIEKGGGVPIMLPPVYTAGAVEKQIEVCDGLVVTGGIDVYPGFYGEEPHPLLEDYSIELDEYQISLIGSAMEKDIPVFCICRGMQLLNIVCGGTLYQDLSLSGNVINHRQKAKRMEHFHNVEIREGSLLYGLLGNTVMVNSLHHQSIKNCGNGLVVTARSSDGIVEAVEMPDKKFVLGVQWHPEMLLLKNDCMLPVFQAFIKSCG